MKCMNIDIIMRMGKAYQFIIRVIVSITGTRSGQWLFAKLAHRLDRFVFRITGGEKTFGALLTGLPIAVLTTTGAKSGLPRRVPVLVNYAGDLPVLIASNWGQKKHPAWYYNLRANPRAELKINGRSTSYIAREVLGDEKERYWTLAIRRYPGYAAYQTRAGGRDIGVWELEPLE